MDEPPNIRFEQSWKQSFPNDPLPNNLTCLNKYGTSDVERHAYRSALQIALDYHNMRVQDLKNKLEKEQFVLEFVAHEIEKLPVPRQSNDSFSHRDMKPSPRPRTPPSVPRKPDPKPRNDDSGAAIRRNKTTPSPRNQLNEKGFHFSSVHIPPEEVNTNFNAPLNIIEESASAATKTQAEPTASEGSLLEADKRFSDFKGNSFMGGPKKQSSTESSAETSAKVQRAESIESNDLAGMMPRKLARDSMKNMEPINPLSSDSSDNSSDTESNSDYMHLWSIPRSKTPLSSQGEVSAQLFALL